MKSGDSLEVKDMRQKVEIFGDMLNEIFNAFNTLSNLKINAFNGVNISKQYDSAHTYLDININDNKPFNQIDTIIDLLQSAFKESDIVIRDHENCKFKMDETLLKFFLTTEMSQVHQMVGNPKKSLLNKFDNFIDNETSYELTFTQKINKIKKIK